MLNAYDHGLVDDQCIQLPPLSIKAISSWCIGVWWSKDRID